MGNSVWCISSIFLVILVLAGCASAGSPLSQHVEQEMNLVVGADQGTTSLLSGPGEEATEPTPVRWNGTISLTGETTFSIHPVNDPTATITVNRTTALGALDTAADAGSFEYAVKSSDWGPFIDSIGGVAYNATTWDSWLYMVNGAVAEVGAADYNLSDGDVVTYWYGAWGSTPEEALDRVTITVRIPTPDAPVANFTASTGSGAAPLYERFTDRSENAVGYSWNFGDGSRSCQQEPTRIFRNPGTFTVALTVFNRDGAASTRSMAITVTDRTTPTTQVTTPMGTTPVVTESPTVTPTANTGPEQHPYPGRHGLPGVVQA